MKITVLTLFPEMFSSPFSASITKRAIDQGKVELELVQLRDFATDAYKTVDDHPYGGGAGMVLKVDVVDRALSAIKASSTTSPYTVLLSAKGSLYTQQTALQYSAHSHLILICGHYEGVDERVKEHLVDAEVRIGNFVLTGGELAAMAIVDSVTRLLEGVLPKSESWQHESHMQPGVGEHPHYTRPAEYRGWKVPEILLGGNHQEIDKWRDSQQITLDRLKSEGSDTTSGSS